MKNGVHHFVFTCFQFCLILAETVSEQDTNSLSYHTDYLSEYEYFAKLNGSFKLHLEPASLDVARQRCEDEGAIVASPINEKFFDEMQLALLRSGLETLRTGIHSDIFVSMEGISLSDMAKCLKVFNSPSNIILLRDGTVEFISSNTRHPYLCYRKNLAPANPDFFEHCRVTGYKYSNITESCYKFHMTGATWFEAIQICESEGGHLAILNGYMEADYLRDVLMHHSKFAIHADHSYLCLLGYYYSLEKSDWVTLDGETIKGAGFAAWAEEEPIRSGRDFDCGAMSRRGELYTIRCDWNAVFVCEINPSQLPKNTTVYDINKL